MGLPHPKVTAMKALALALAAPLALSACYVIPINPDGSPAALPPGIVLPVPHGTSSAPVPPAAPSQGKSVPAALPARLYPANEIATQTGVVSGTVTNMMSGKGRFRSEERRVGQE